MKRISTTVGMALAAMLVLSALAVANAFAAMPEFSPSTGNGTFAAPTANLAGVECKKNEGTFTIESATGGTFTELFKGCKEAGIVTCTGEGESSGMIAVKGTFMLGLIKLEETGAGIAFLPEPTKFACAGTKIEVTGCVAGPITPTNTKTKMFTVTLTATSGKQTPDEFESKSCTLKAKEGSGSQKEASLEETVLTAGTTDVEIT
jgi:hypothetical protein